MNNLFVFSLFVAASLGQFMDTRTTEVGLANGFVESNPIGKFLINKLGISVTYALKSAALPIGAVWLAAAYPLAGYVALGILAGAGFVAFGLNYSKLSAAAKKEVF